MWLSDCSTGWPRTRLNLATRKYPHKADQAHSIPLPAPLAQRIDVFPIAEIRHPESRLVLFILGRDGLLQVGLSRARRPTGSPLGLQIIDLLLVAGQVRCDEGVDGGIINRFGGLVFVLGGQRRLEELDSGD